MSLKSYIDQNIRENYMLWFRIGSFALIATGFIHLIGHFRGINPANETEKQLIDLMTGYVLQPINITMMELFNGFSLFYALFFLMTGELDLWLSRAYKENPTEVKKIAVVNIIGLGVGTGISFYYFFFAPILCISIALVCFVISFFTIKAPE